MTGTSRCHAATPEEVQRVIELCPSGALTCEVPSEYLVPEADLWALPLAGERKPFPVVQTSFAGYDDRLIGVSEGAPRPQEVWVRRDLGGLSLAKAIL